MWRIDKKLYEFRNAGNKTWDSFIERKLGIKELKGIIKWIEIKSKITIRKIKNIIVTNKDAEILFSYINNHNLQIHLFTINLIKSTYFELNVFLIEDLFIIQLHQLYLLVKFITNNHNYHQYSTLNLKFLINTLGINPAVSY